MNDDYLLRFGGIGRLYGQQPLTWLAQAHFCVIGIGGVGSWAVEALARTGVGQLTLIDLDDICTTNTNRQIHALQGTVGHSKTDVMAARVGLINPDCKVHCVDDFVSKDNIAELIQGFDYVIDCIDAVQAKTALIAHCKRRKIPVITIGGAGGKIDPSQIQYGDLAKTIQDPLLAKVRSYLRRDYQFTKNPKRKFDVDCVFSTEQLRYPQADGSVCAAKASAEGSMRLDCNSGFGAVTMVTASFAFMACARAVEKYLARCVRRASADGSSAEPSA